MCKEFGFQSIKLKGGALPPQAEVDCILALREAFGSDTPLRLDPNAIWSVETAIEYGKKMEGALEYYEDPTRGQENMAKVAKHSPYHWRQICVPLPLTIYLEAFNWVQRILYWQITTTGEG